MKISSTISFVVLVELIYLTQMTLSHKCVEYSGPVYRNEFQLVECPMVSSKDKRQIPTVPTASPASSTTISSSAGDMFTIDFSCSINNQALCDKVQNVFINAGKYITATINFNSVVNIQAQFLDFCENFNECDTQEIILGAAGPTRLIPYQGPTDDKVRLYPQSLLKQMNLAEYPQFSGTSDITATFNSRMDFWFEGDPSMTESQADMLYVVVHELNHGLGFIDSWNTYFNLQALTPYVVGSSNTSSVTPGSSTSSSANGEFMELIFDKNLIYLPTGQPLTFITDQLNNFSINLASSDSEIISSFQQSPQYPLAQDVYNHAVTHGDLGFLLKPGIPPNTSLTPNQIQSDVFILETSLSPFEPGSSIAHADFQTYLNTSDFLMMFTYPPGETLSDMMNRAGSTTTTGPMGPNLRAVMGVLGYDIKQVYTPPVISAASTIGGYNLVLSLVCIIIVFIQI